MVLMIVMMVLKNTSHISYKQLTTFYLTEKSDPNVCINDGKEGVDDNVDDDVDNSDGGDDMHLTHLTQVENNVNIVVCDKHLNHVVNNTLESLRSDVTGHVTHVRFFEKIQVSNNAILLLRGGGLKGNRGSIDNGQKDNDEKNNEDINNQ
eukprot:10400359-Ditylum_brightwellii.AAC.1